MLVPIKNVIKTDLIQVSMDYNVANITSPDNFFTIGDGGLTSSYVVIEEGLYTIDVLASWLQQQLTTELGPGITVYYTVNSKLMIELKAQSNVDNIALNRLINFSSAKLSYALGISNSPIVAGSLTPVYNGADGKYGTFRWTFPYPVQLAGIYPYLFIQSRALGTDIRVANGNLGFWRMLLNNQVDYELSMVNNRVDTYTNNPITLQDIDVKLVYPDGTVVNNNGGRFTLLLEIVRQV